MKEKIKEYKGIGKDVCLCYLYVFVLLNMLQFFYIIQMAFYQNL